MARGLPDYNVKDTEVSQSVDYQDAIITSNLGLNTVDGFGRLYYVNTFNEGVSDWISATNGDATAATIRYGCGEFSDAGCRMYAGTMLNASLSAISKGFMLGGAKSIGIEIGIKIPTNRPTLLLQASFRSGSVYMIGSLKYTYQNILQVYNNGVGYENLGSFFGASIESEWLPIKMVLNANTITYDRIIIGQTRYENLTQIPQNNINLGDAEIVISIQAISGGAGKTDLNIGHLFLTTDEP